MTTGEVSEEDDYLIIIIIIIIINTPQHGAVNSVVVK